jgi:putative Holliday junction resolvase
MRIMAVDYGDARTGVAVSDETAALVGEAWVLQEKKSSEVALYVATEAASRGVVVIVVGYPKNMNGSVGPRAEKSEQLAEQIRKLCEIEVVLWDERMTTMSAHRILSDAGRYGKKRKNTVDAVAASLILENYLTYLHGKKAVASNSQ